MKISDIVSMSFGSLWRRKARTILTVLGVIIGTASITVMLSLGVGMNESVKKNLSQMGGINTITVHQGYGMEKDMAMKMGMSPNSTRRQKDDTVYITDDIIAQIEAIPNVKATMKSVNVYLKFVSGKYIGNFPVVGIDPQSMKEFGFNLGEGRFLEESDTTAIFFGGQVPYEFRDPKSRYGNEFMYYEMRNGEEKPEPNVDVFNDSMIMTFDHSFGERMPSGYSQPNKPKYKRYRVTGVGMTPTDEYSEYSWQAYMNIDYVLKIKQENNKIEAKANGQKPDRNKEIRYEQLKVLVDNVKNVKDVQQQIMDLGLNAHNMADMMEDVKKQTGIIEAVLGGIGAISLLVAAIGITNTMIMSIYERTKEIGIMKVIGCKVKHIRGMFLLESAFIGLIGGVIGIGISFGLSVLLNKFIGPELSGGMRENIPDISIIPLWLVLAAIAFSTVIGVVSGFYPAIRATRVSALKAIHNE